MATIVGNNSWGHISDTDASEEDSNDETLVENSVLTGEDYSYFGHSNVGSDWFVEEMLPLERLFRVQESEDEKLKVILEELNMDFGVNSKCIKNGEKEGRVDENLVDGEIVSNDEC